MQEDCSSSNSECDWALVSHLQTSLSRVHLTLMGSLPRLPPYTPVSFYKHSITLTHGQTGCLKLSCLPCMCADRSIQEDRIMQTVAAPVTAQHAKKHKHLVITMPLLSLQPFKADNCSAQVIDHKHKLNIWTFLWEKTRFVIIWKTKDATGPVEIPRLASANCNHQSRSFCYVPDVNSSYRPPERRGW